MRAGRPTVLHILEALEGGTARHVVDVVRAVVGVDHHVALPDRRVGVPTDHLAAPAMQAAGATLHLLPMTRSPLRPTNAVAVVRIRRLAAAVEADVVHGHSSVAGALARVAAAGTGRPAFYTPNGLAQGRAALALERVLVAATHTFVAVSASEAALARSRLRVPEGRLVTIPNGIERDVPAARVDLRGALGVPADAPLVGTVARLNHQKAPERFLAVAWALTGARADLQVVLIGDGPLANEVEEIRAGHARLDPGRAARVHHLRHVEAAAGVLDQLDAFVLTSRFEGGPYAPLEAMRVGTPVILSDVVGSRDIVVAGDSGVLVAPDDIDGYVTAVLDVLADRATAMGGRGRARQQTLFDLASAGARLGDLYREAARRT